MGVSTCRMAHLSLPNSELHVGTRAQGNPRLEALCRTPGVALLFPSAGASDVRTLAAPPQVLVVVDGTWANAKKIVKSCPVLAQLPRVSLAPEKPGNYRIRREPAAHCLATIEAVTLVLEHLERAPGRFAPMLRAFDAMVEKQLAYIAATGDRTRHRRREGRRPRAEVDRLSELRAAAAKGDLVAVFGEANAWPADAGEGRDATAAAELLALRAERLSTGERFAALLRPQGPLSPAVPCQLDLPASAFEAAEARGTALGRWERFLGQGDVLLGWGPFCAALLAREGLTERPFIDLRAVLSRVSSRRPGSVEACASLLGASLPHGEGRAARRLVALVAVARGLLAGTLLPLLPREPRLRSSLAGVDASAPVR